MMRGLILAAPQSGSGKTVITQAFIRHLLHQGHTVIPAKTGPDYIDPQFLSLAARKSCINLDPWAMRPQSRAMLLAQAHEANALLIIEGVMGLFDGARDGTGSTADLAQELDLPVVLVVNAAKQSASIAALVQGFIGFREKITIAGVILNNVASPRHEAMLRAAIMTHCPDTPILGAVPRDDVFILPERHLGLVQAVELDDHDARLDIMAERLGGHLDTAAVCAVAQPVTETSAQKGLLPAGVQHLAVARDHAFSFLYSGQILSWQQQGCAVTFFSPLNDEIPDPKAEAVFLPGGYPELFAEQLSQAKNFHAALHRAAERNIPVCGECGGYMVLGRYLVDHQGQQHDMLGLLPVGFRLLERKRALGYRQITVLHDHLFGAKGTVYRGHEFHYATADVLSDTACALFQAVDAGGTPCAETGFCHGSVQGSFLHLIDTL